MDYFRSVTLDGEFDDAVARVKDAFQEQGFGALTDIDMQATLRNKTGADIEPYRIIGACNPQLAQRAVEAVPPVGVFLPCNVVVRRSGGRTVVDAMDPSIMAQVIDDPTLQQVAAEATDRVQAALDTLAAPAS